MKYVLPYIIAGEKPTRSFMEVEGFDDIGAAAASCEIELRAKYTKLLGRRVCVAVAHVNFSHRNRETGEMLPPPPRQEPQAAYRPFRRRRQRNAGGVWRG